MIVPVHAPLADVTVEAFLVRFSLTLRAERPFYVNQWLGSPSWRFPQQQRIQHDYYYLIYALAQQWDKLNVFLIGGELGEHVYGQEENMEEKYEVKRIQIRLPLWLIHYFLVAFDADFVYEAIIIVQDPSEVFLMVLTGDIERGLPTLVLVSPVGPLN